MMIGPIEESFAMMNRYQLHYPSSDAERVDGLTYAWKKLNTQVDMIMVMMIAKLMIMRRFNRVTTVYCSGSMLRNMRFLNCAIENTYQQQVF